MTEEQRLDQQREEQLFLEWLRGDEDSSSWIAAASESDPARASARPSDVPPCGKGADAR
jgi:hypothetical protein